MFVLESQVGFVPVHHFMAGTECWLNPCGSYLVFLAGLAAADMHSGAASPISLWTERPSGLGRVVPSIVRSSVCPAGLNPFLV